MSQTDWNPRVRSSVLLFLFDNFTWIQPKSPSRGRERQRASWNHYTKENRATKNVQLVLQHCCKTSWIATLHILPPWFKPVNKLICCKTGLMWVVKHATLQFNSFCSNGARQVARFLLPVFPYLKIKHWTWETMICTSIPKYLQQRVFQQNVTNFSTPSKMIFFI